MYNHSTMFSLPIAVSIGPCGSNKFKQPPVVGNLFVEQWQEKLIGLVAECIRKQV